MLVQPAAQVTGREHRAVDVEPLVRLRLDRLQRLVEAYAEDSELQGVEELVHLLAVPLPEVQVVRTDRERHVATELGELPFAYDLGHVPPQRGAGLAFDLTCPVDERVQGA